MDNESELAAMKQRAIAADDGLALTGIHFQAGRGGWVVPVDAGRSSGGRSMGNEAPRAACEVMAYIADVTHVISVSHANSIFRDLMWPCGDLHFAWPARGPLQRPIQPISAPDRELLHACFAATKFSVLRRRWEDEDRLAAELVRLAGQGFLTADGDALGPTALARLTLGPPVADVDRPLREVTEVDDARLVAYLAAQSESEVDSVFDEIFELVDRGRHTGDFAECERLLRWIVRADVIGHLHVDVLLSSLRLTSTVRQKIPGWSAALKGVEHELSDRGADVEALLWGLNT